MTRALRVGIAGLGTVGTGVLGILQQRAGAIADAAGRPVELVAVSARDRTKNRGVDLSGVRFEEDACVLARDPEIDLFVELIGGSEGVARDAVTQALEAGKSVVTANKALIAHHGLALAELAERKGVVLNYEAAVAGGIPIVKTMRESLVGNDISSVFGILNGTCNFILSEMEDTGRDFADVLKEAQDLGYAEADPTFDVGGIDAAHKLAILASLAFGTKVSIDAVQTEGIERITATDIAYAADFGYRIRLLAIARREAGQVETRVHPALVPAEGALAAVKGATNAVAVTGHAVGTVVLEGQGAGAGPTASSVLSDIVDVARGLVLPAFIVPSDRLTALDPLPSSVSAGQYFLRLNASDRAGSLAAIAGALGEAGVSIERIVQRGPGRTASGEEIRIPVVIETHETDAQAMASALELLKRHETVTGTPLLLRIEKDRAQS